MIAIPSGILYLGGIIVVIIVGLFVLFKRKSKPLIKEDSGNNLIKPSNTSIKILSSLSLLFSISALVLTICEFIFNWLIFGWLSLLSLYTLGVIFSIIAFIKYRINKISDGKILVYSAFIISILFLCGIFLLILGIIISFSRGM